MKKKIIQIEFECPDDYHIEDWTWVLQDILKGETVKFKNIDVIE